MGKFPIECMESRDLNPGKVSKCACRCPVPSLHSVCAPDCPCPTPDSDAAPALAQAYVIEFDGREVPISTLEGVTIEQRPSPPGQPGPGNYLGTPNNYTWSAVVIYQPRARQAGSKNKVCVTSSDEWKLDTIRRCLYLETGTCKACLRAGQVMSPRFPPYASIRL